MQVPVRIDQVPLALDLVHYPDSDGFHDADIALGMSAFTHLDFELDFAAGKMYLYSQSRCGAGVVHWADNFARVPMRDGYLVAELNGQKIETGLATVAGATWLDAEAASTLFDIVLSIADGDSQDFVFMSLTAEGIEIMDANVQIAGVDHGIDCRLHSSQGRDRAAGYFGCENSYPFNLGLDIIQTMHLYFATRERALYFTHRDDRRTAP
jgi:hypothetical protein